MRDLAPLSPVCRRRCNIMKVYMTTEFTGLGLHQILLQNLAKNSFTTPTPIQAKAIPQVMDGHDLLGIAQTGTGKTAAFALPLLHKLFKEPKRASYKHCRVLVLSPTRELATQIMQTFRMLAQGSALKIITVFGGMPMGQQRQALLAGVDVLVATPGRLLDHMSQGNVSLGEVEAVVLDEADQMLDMGFIQPLKRIVAALPKKRQGLFFSATMPPAIRSLAENFLTSPVEVAVTPVAKTADRVEQKVIHVEASQKRRLLVETLSDASIERALVFARTKHGADKLVTILTKAGLSAAALHGNKTQAQRTRALAGFKDGSVTILVATDIAARGIHVDNVSHVVNYEMPNIPESYVHRIGRTARAGAEGIAVSFVDASERSYLKAIERLIGHSIHATSYGPQGADPTAALAQAERAERADRGGRGRGGERRHSGERHGGERHGERHGERGHGGERGRTGERHGGERRGGEWHGGAERPGGRFAGERPGGRFGGERHQTEHHGVRDEGDAQRQRPRRRRRPQAA